MRDPDSLERVLRYRNDRVVNKFRTFFAVDKPAADEVFTETKKWLWLCAKRLRGIRAVPERIIRPLVIHTSMVVIDEMWHVFVLHTKDYTDFCADHFGEYVHHSPGHPGFVPMTDAQNREQLEFIAEHLGAETLLRWYEEYDGRYPPARLRELYRSPEFGRPCEAP